jgi:hypothetical protein
MLFQREVIHLHGPPEYIITDRDQILSEPFWKTLCHYLGINRKLTSEYHPEIDGQIERQNNTLEEYLRISVLLNRVIGQGKSTWLNSHIIDSIHAATGLTPVQEYTGSHP